jgi:hypothetical protein
MRELGKMREDQNLALSPLLINISKHKKCIQKG